MTALLCRGGSRIYFRRGCTRLLLYFNTNKPHFFLQNTSCIRKPQVISGRGGAHPLHPPPRSAPAVAALGLWSSGKLGRGKSEKALSSTPPPPFPPFPCYFFPQTESLFTGYGCLKINNSPEFWIPKKPLLKSRQPNKILPKFSYL